MGLFWYFSKNFEIGGREFGGNWGIFNRYLIEVDISEY